MTSNLYEGARVIYVTSKDYTHDALIGKIGTVISGIYDGNTGRIVDRKSENYDYCKVNFENTEGSVEAYHWCDNLKLIEVDVGDLEDDF